MPQRVLAGAGRSARRGLGLIFGVTLGTVALFLGLLVLDLLFLGERSRRG
jgi:hypothetical protein